MDAILLDQKNKVTIVSFTKDMDEETFDKLFEEVDPIPGTSWFIVRNYLSADGTFFDTWTIMTQHYISEFFDFDEQTILTQYTDIARKEDSDG